MEDDEEIDNYAMNALITSPKSPKPIDTQSFIDDRSSQNATFLLFNSEQETLFE